MNRSAEPQRRDVTKADLVDALDHIARVCRGSRTQTRRIRWIELRATCAIDGTEDWRNGDMPRMDPVHERLIETIREIYPLVREVHDAAELTLKECKPDDPDFAQAKADLEATEAFLSSVRQNAHWIPREADRAPSGDAIPAPA